MKTTRATNKQPVLIAGGQTNPSLLAFMLTFIIIFALSFEHVFALGFSDTEGNFAEMEISMLRAKGIVNGDGTNFFPGKHVTRAEFAKMLVVALGYEADAEEIKNYPAVFSDINGHWAEGFITEAWELGIAGGEGTRFFPDRSINRAEMVTMLFRAFRIAADSNAEKNRQMLAKFKDRADIPSWAASYVAMASEKGITSGTPEGLFEPLRPASRAEAAKVLAAAAAQQGYIYDYIGILGMSDGKPGEISLAIDGVSVDFQLSADAEAYKNREKVEIKDLKGRKVYIVLKDEKVAFIKEAGE
ncbi:MAG: S-layer homology domain-containing protein [Tepidanaerobacteraceae bacterium]|jgi:hypothetical protein|nr:S-layer homology domain-containing protein [Tepidanaerobacteraceae bacterium]